MSSEIVKFPKVIILLCVCTFANFMAILFTPSLPLLAGDFGIQPSEASLTMSIFLIGYALGQLPYGPLSNRFGRKGALTIGFIIALFGTLIALFATSFWALCVGRFLQAIGSSAGLKVAFTMVADSHAGVAATKAIAIFSLAFGFSPGIAQAIGGFMTIIGGWKACFLLLAVYAVVVWILTQFLPETSREIHKDALQWKKIGDGYMRQFKDPYIVLHALMAGLATTAMYIFVTISPYVAQSVIGLSPEVFGLWALVPSFGLVTGGLIMRRLSHKNPRIMMLSGILIFLISMLILSLCFVNSIITVWSLFIPAYFLYIGGNVIWSNALSHGLNEAVDKSNASAVMQFINMGSATVGVFLVQTALPTDRLLLPAAFGVIVVLLFAVWLKLKAHHPK
ncbi:MAG: MFS transporter [Parachlamydiales bacterium]|nr:MFS transporter [Parachlamydiales bacterium]